MAILMMVGACMHARILRKPIFDRINTDLCKQTLILQYYYFEISGIGTLLQLAPAGEEVPVPIQPDRPFDITLVRRSAPQESVQPWK